jgi:hypothetical protein
MIKLFHHTCLISTWTSSHFLSANYFLSLSLSLTYFSNLCSWKPVWKSEIRRENNKSLLKLKLNTSKSFLFALVKKPSRLQTWSLFYILLWSIPPPTHTHTQKPRRYMITYTISSTHAQYPLYPMPTELLAFLLSSLDCLL